MESGIWEQLMGLPSVSTMSILANCGETGTQVRLLTAENFGVVRGELAISAKDLREIEEKVFEGKVVLLPECEQRILDWHGIGYIALDRENYTGEYLISGGLTNGVLSGGNSSVEVGLAYLLNIVLTAIDMAGAICMIPMIATAILTGGPLGLLVAAGLFAFVYAVLLWSLEEIYDTYDMMEDYINGDEEAGERLVSRAYVNAAMTAVFAVGGMVAKGVAKAGAKSIPGKVIGLEWYKLHNQFYEITSFVNAYL